MSGIWLDRIINESVSQVFSGRWRNLDPDQHKLSTRNDGFVRKVTFREMHNKMKTGVTASKLDGYVLEQIFLLWYVVQQAQIGWFGNQTREIYRQW